MKLQDVIPLKEGGFAMKSAGVTRIKRKDVHATIKYVSELSGIPTKDLHKIGSTGKAESSGDLDLAVDSNEYNPTTIHQRLMDKLNGEGTYNKSTKVASYAVPIRGDVEKGKVQVDLMYSPNVEWAKFAYYSEGENSKYKGAVRAILLSAVAAAIREPGTDHFEYTEDGELLIRAGRTVDLSQGLRRIFQYRPQKQKGDGYTKTLKSIPIEDFKKMFPHVEVKGGQVIVDDPNKVVKALFGSGASPSDVRTAEQIIHLIKKRFDEDTQKDIFKFASQRAKSVVGKMKLPPELLENM